MSPAGKTGRLRDRRMPHRVFGIVLALVTAAAAAQAQTPREIPLVTAVVPVVGTVSGVNGLRWRTEVILRNDLGSPVQIVMELPAAPDQPFYATTLAAGQSLRFGDVAAEAFSMDEILSPMLVSTAGRRSISIMATAYGIYGDDPPVAQPISVDYGGSYYPQRTLQGLSFSDAYRTNIGLANIDDSHDATFTLALQRIPGRNIAVTRITLGPRTAWHSAIQTLFPLIPTGSGFTVVVETSSQKSCVYASVLDNATSHGRFIQPTIGALTPSP